MKRFVFVVTKEIDWWESGTQISTNLFNTKEKAINFAKKELNREIKFFLKSYNEITITKVNWAKHIILAKDSHAILTIYKMEVR